MLRSEGNSKGKPVRTDANDRTGAALSEATAELGAVQPEIVTQGVEQRHIGFDVHRLILAIHAERYFCHRRFLSKDTLWQERCEQGLRTMYRDRMVKVKIVQKKA